MKSVPLGEVAEINPRARRGASRTDQVAFVGMADLDPATATATDSVQREFGEVSKGYTPFERGDVLVAKITPCFENMKIGQAHTSTQSAFGSTEFHVVRARDGQLDSRYVLHYLRQNWVRRDGERQMTGSAGQRRVPSRFVETLPIPLPPIEEQRRIAAVLDAADALRAKRRQALAKLDTLTQSIFIDMFGDPVRNTKGWTADRRLADVATVRSGITVGRRTAATGLVPVPYLAVVNVQDGFIQLDPLKSIDASVAEIDRYGLAAGDILLTEGGDPDKLGRGAIWHREIDPCIHQNHVFCVRIKDDSLTSDFLSRLIGSERGKRYFLRMAKQTTGIASINMSQLKAFPILEPPRELQEEFLRRADALKSRSGAAAASAAQLDTLFASLQRRAFRGEL